MRSGLIFSMLCFLFVGFSTPANAGRCSQYSFTPIEKVFLRSDVIFKGVGTKRRNDSFFTFDVSEVYKAPLNFDLGQSIDVFAQVGNARYEDGTPAPYTSDVHNTIFEEGKEYLIYGWLGEDSKEKDSDVDIYVTPDTSCGQTNKTLQQEISDLRERADTPDVRSSSPMIFSGKVIKATHWDWPEHESVKQISNVTFEVIETFYSKYVEDGYENLHSKKLTVLGCGNAFQVGEKYLVHVGSRTKFENHPKPTVTSGQNDVHCGARFIRRFDEEESLKEMSKYDYLNLRKEDK